MTSWRLQSQPAEDRLRVLRHQWVDVLRLPTCLVILALYEWWRWLFSIPANPLLLTIVAAVALTQVWRRRKVYRAEMIHLQLDNATCTARELIVSLRSAAQHLSQELVEQLWNRVVPLVAQTIWLPFKSLCQARLSGPLSKNLLSTYLSGLKKNVLWLNR
jgi:hypothetical protein